MSEPPKLKQIGRRLFVLEKDYEYTFPWKPSECVVIPAGYKTNFATIPAWARWLISPTDESILIPSLVHDWLVLEFGTPLKIEEGAVRTQKRMEPMIYAWVNGSRIVVDLAISWDQAAAILRKGMKFEGASSWKRFLVYWAVRFHGRLMR